jgi:hypothetical protein
VLVVTRYRVTPEDAATFQAEARAALDVLALQKGWLAGRLGRNVDEPDLWVLTTEWENVGSYRRALSPFDVKITAVPLLSRCIDEPSAFELVEVLGARAGD